MDYKPDEIHSRFAGMLIGELDFDTLDFLVDEMDKAINDLMELVDRHGAIKQIGKISNMQPYRTKS